MFFHDWFEKFEQYFLELLREKRHRPIDRFITGILFIASRFYRYGVQFRLWLYGKRILRDRALGCQVISIGNLTCGGTGKTPVVEIFARTLSQKGRRVAILSRGYRSKDNRTGAEKEEVRIVSKGGEPLLDSINAGDEPYMLAQNLRGVSILVDKDRYKSGRLAINELDVDTIVLDDGFQYLGLQSHINILLVDATAPFDNHHVLPRGLLREPIENIRRADFIFLTKADEPKYKQWNPVKREKNSGDGAVRSRHQPLKDFIRKHNFRAEIIECCHCPKYFQTVHSRNGEKEQYPLEYLKGKRVASLTAIAKPASFNAFLAEQGGIKVLERHFADHHRYTEEELLEFVKDAKAANADVLMTTEKDAVRMPELKHCDLPLLFLRIEIKILDDAGQKNFADCISRICINNTLNTGDAE